MKTLFGLIIIIAQLFLGYEIFQIEWRMNDTTKNLRALQTRVDEAIKKLPPVYFVVDVKNPAKYCKKTVKWCYWQTDNLLCFADKKALPDGVTQFEICAQ